MQAGNKIQARTHAELLNRLLNRHCKSWYKCTYDIDQDTFIWMVKLDGTDNYGRRNKFDDGKTIMERFDDGFPKNDRFMHGLTRKYRLVFEKEELSVGRVYTFRGLYKLVNVEEDGYLRTLKLVQNDYHFENER